MTKETYTFERTNNDERITVLFNAGEENQNISLPGKAGDQLFGKLEIAQQDDGFDLLIGPRQGAVIKGA